MNLSADALLFLAGKGLSVEDIAAFVRLTEQRKDHTAADRMARHRAKRRGESVTRNVTANPPIEELHTPVPDISSDEESQSQSERDDCGLVAERWNAVAGKLDLPRCSKMAGKRRKACQARLRSDGFDQIVQAIEHVPKSAFLRGDAGNWSGANIDFLLKPDSVTQILEGKYDDRPNKIARPTGGPSPDRRSTLARAIDEGRDWLDSAQAGLP